MGLEQVVKYKGYAIDYSFICEYAGSGCFNDFIELIKDGSKDIYISKNFKLFHYCYTHQIDDRNAVISDAMRRFVSNTLPLKVLHELNTPNTVSFIHELNKLDGICLITAKNGILFKRMMDRKPDFMFPLVLFDGNNFDFYENANDCYQRYKNTPVSPLASRKEYLDSKVFCNVGDRVVTDKGDRLQLTKRISNGAEGMVFFTDNPKYVAKIYNKGQITPLRWAKLRIMVERGINSPDICWPQNLIFMNEVPVGYTMLIGKGSTLNNVFDGPDAMMDRFPNWTRMDVVETAVNLLEKYIYLHMHNIYIGDIQSKNAMVFSQKDLFLIDMDSCQIDNFPCPVGTEEFTSPALWGKDFSSFLRTPAHEDYCLSILMFSIIFCGQHPYATRLGKETLREEMLERNFPYTLDNSDVEHIPLGGYQYIWEALTDELRKLMYDAFALGKNHEAIEWYSALVNYRKALVDKNFEDWESYKVFPKMDYSPTTLRESSVKDDVKSPFTKGSIKDSIIVNSNNDSGITNMSGGYYGSRSNSSANAKKSSSAYVPKMLRDEEKTDKGNEKKGFFKKLFNGDK